MSGGGGQQQQQTQQNTAPWEAQQPYLLRGFQEAEANFNREKENGGPGYFPGSTVSPYGEQSTQALGNIWNYATSGGNAGLLNSQAAGLAANGGQGLGGFQGLAGGALGRAGGQTINSIANQGGAETLAGGGTLANTANGGMLGRNPEFQAMADNAIMAARPSMEAAFAGSGRLGSGAHAQAFADSANRATTSLAYQDYQNERGLQQQAATALAGLDQNAIQQRLAAAGQLGQLDLSGYTAAMQGDLAARQLGFQGLGQGQDMAYQNLGAQQGVGQAWDSQAQAYLQDDINRWNWDQNMPRDQLATYMGFVNGQYGSQGSGTTTMPSSKGSVFGSVAGGALSGAGAGFMVGGPVGAAIGGVGGGILGAIR